MEDLLPVDTASPDETVRVGEALADELGPGQVVALFGDLGSGKTHLAKGICSGLGIDPHHVTSPTFVLINEYSGGRLPVYHFDTYRLQNLSDFLALGYEDYFEGDGVCIVEWPERIESLLPAHAVRLRLSHRGSDTRHIELAHTG